VDVDVLSRERGKEFRGESGVFEEAKERGRWRVRVVKGGEWLDMPERKGEGGEDGNKQQGDGERQPLLGGLLGGSS